MAKQKALVSGLSAIMMWMLLITAGQAVSRKPDFDGLPVTGRVTIIEMGSRYCVPCKLMVPILAKVEKTYRGQAAVVSIDGRKYREQARRFRVRVFPTQIFFDTDGREVWRHEGFLSEKAIIHQLAKMGLKSTGAER